MKQRTKTSIRIAKSFIAFTLAFTLTLPLNACAPEEHTLVESSVEFSSSQFNDREYIPPEPPKVAVVSFAGDCILSNIQNVSNYSAVYNQNGPEYFLSGVQNVFAHDDLTVVNLETPLTSAETRAYKGEEKDEDGKTIAYWFKAPPEYVNILTTGSVDLVNLANNHTYDYGVEGYVDTQENLNAAGVEYFGNDVTIVREVNGIKIGFFGLAFNTNPNNIYAAMDELRANGAEVIVAYFHDGTEYSYTPSQDQFNAAYTAADYGASAVLMSHVHKIQGVQTYNGTFIAYAMGNFTDGAMLNPEDKDAMIIQLEFVKENDEITCTPTVIPCLNSSSTNTNDHRPVALIDENGEPTEEGRRVLNHIDELSQF